MTQARTQKDHLRFAVRVVSQLGAELISSDDIALYELIKNGFDAGSRSVAIEIQFHVDVVLIRELQDLVQDSSEDDWRPVTVRDVVCDRLRNAVGEKLCRMAESDLAKFHKRLSRLNRPKEFVKALGTLNSIGISDTGCGMAREDIVTNFLTLGTPHRYRQHEAARQTGKYETAIPPTGEKGLGRLSAMRLGHDLQLRSSTFGSATEQRVKIEWRLFSVDSTLPANRIPVFLSEVPRDETESSGTVLRITDLQSNWTREKTIRIAHNLLSRFVNPFDETQRRRVRITHNGEAIPIPKLSRIFLEEAHNCMKGSVRFRDGRFTLSVDYWFTLHNEGKKHRFSDTYTSADFGGILDKAVADLGPFSFELYHYNRRHLTMIPGVATRKEFKTWLDQWSGGLMLYRDGVRVMPYGRQPDDDWLNLDKQSIRGSGYRVNRIQAVGCVRISRKDNPLLQDQTNREGLRDNDAFQTLREFLDHCVQKLFVGHLEDIGRSDTDPAELVERADESHERLAGAIDKFLAAISKGDKATSTEAAKELQDQVDDFRQLANELEQLVQAQATKRVDFIELAASGMDAEMFAHDLEASIDNAITDLSSALRTAPGGSQLEHSVRHLIAVFKSLRHQIATLKPTPAKWRRRRSKVNVTKAAHDLLGFYQGRLDRHAIRADVKNMGGDEDFYIKAVDGHIRQVLENLLRNAIYWLLHTRENFGNDAPSSRIQITLDHRSRSILFEDSGVGIKPNEAEWIFEAFTSRRREGHGLGLYIGRQMCDFNKIRLEVDMKKRNQWDRYSRFVLDCSDCYVED